jgi:hypothetical protein
MKRKFIYLSEVLSIYLFYKGEVEIISTKHFSLFLSPEGVFLEITLIWHYLFYPVFHVPFNPHPNNLKKLNYDILRNTFFIK